jgi:hypothetical protein
MKTFRILNHLEDLVKTITVNSIEELKDVIYDLEAYHGHYNTYTYEEVK